MAGAEQRPAMMVAHNHERRATDDGEPRTANGERRMHVYYLYLDSTRAVSDRHLR